jgi:hypothetical protein
MGSVITMALANITNLPLILDFTPILISWLNLSYFIFGLLTSLNFWLIFSSLSSHFVIQSRRRLPVLDRGYKILFWLLSENPQVLTSINGFQPLHNRLVLDKVTGL